jgi:hypothetical protein
MRALATFAEDNFDALLRDPRCASELLWRVAEAAAAPASASGPAAFTEGRALQHCLPLLYALAKRHAGLDVGQVAADEAEQQEQGDKDGAASDGGGERARRSSRGRSPSGGGSIGGGRPAWSPREFARGLTALAALKYTEPDALVALAEACRPLLRSMRARELGRLAAALGGGGLYLGGGGGRGRGGGNGGGDASVAASAPAARPAPGWLAAFMAAAAAALAAGAGVGGPGGGGGGVATPADAARCLWGLARLGVRPSAAWMAAYWSSVVPMLMAMGLPVTTQQPEASAAAAEEAQALVLLAEALAEARFVAASTASPPPFAALTSAAGTPAAVAVALWPRALLDALAAPRLAALGAPSQAALLSALARVRLAPGEAWLSAFSRATLPTAQGFSPWQAAGCVEALGDLLVVEEEEQTLGGGAGALSLGLAGGGGDGGGGGGGGGENKQQQPALLLPDGLGVWLGAALAAVEAQLPQLGARELAALLRGLARLLLRCGASAGGDGAAARRAAARALPLMLQRAAGGGHEGGPDGLLRRFGAGDLAGLQQAAVQVWLRSGGGGAGGGGGGGSSSSGGPLSDAWLSAWCAEATQKLPVMSAPELVRVLDGLAATLVMVVRGKEEGSGGSGDDAAAAAAAVAAAAAARALARDAALMLEVKRSVLSAEEARVADLALERVLL